MLWRDLTAGEVALGRVMFEPDGAWEQARILHAPLPVWVAVVPFGRTIVFSAANARSDFSDAPSHAKGLFIHELTHVWQATRGVVLALAKLGALGRRAYRVKLEPGKPWHRYNIEQQAEIVRMLFLARSGLSTLQPFETAALERAWASRDTV